MSFLVGDIARARLSHDVRQHLEQEQEPIEPEVCGDGTGCNDEGSSVGQQMLEAGSAKNEDTSPANLVYYDPETDPEMFLAKMITPTELFSATTTGQGRLEGADVASRRGLVVLQGLPTEYVRCLLDIKELDLDPAFLDAHAERRGYRPTGRWKGRKQLCVECWEFPELLQGFRLEAGSDFKWRGDVLDGMRTPAVYPVGHKGLAAVFRRAALWISEGFVPILFLDRSIWKSRGSTPSIARRGSYATTLRHGEGPQQRRVVPSFGDRVPELLIDLHSTGPCGNVTLEGAIHHAWLDLFEMLEPPTAQHTSREVTTSLYWRIMSALEQNKNATSTERSPQNRVEWGQLLSQVHWRISLLAATPIPPSRKLALTPTSTEILVTGPNGPKLNTLGGNSTLPPGRVPGRSDRGILDDENHRALDRISYLGGILIPLPIVSGILSMGEIFGPEGPKFWIFWAASIPLSVLAGFIIYADTIRKAEVWVEVATEHVATVSPSADTQMVQEHDEKMNASWRRRNRRVVEQDVEAQAPLAGQTRTSGATAKILATEAARVDDEAEIMSVLVGLAPEQLAPLPPDMILEESTHGRKPKAWKRQKLGWHGAAKAIVYPRRKPRYCTHGAPQGVAAYDKRIGKTETY